MKSYKGKLLKRKKDYTPRTQAEEDDVSDEIKHLSQSINLRLGNTDSFALSLLLWEIDQNLRVLAALVEV